MEGFAEPTEGSQCQIRMDSDTKEGLAALLASNKDGIRH